MIGYHCGTRVNAYVDTEKYFQKRCAICKKVFKQKKRIGKEGEKKAYRKDWR